MLFSDSPSWFFFLIQMVKLQGTALAVFLVLTISYNILLTTYVATTKGADLSVSAITRMEREEIERQLHNVLVKYEKIKREDAEK